MKVKLLTMCLVIGIVTACDQRSSQKPPAGNDTFGTRIPDHPLSEFRRLQPFEAKVLHKKIWSIPDAYMKKTNFLVSLILEQADGKRLGVSARAESEDLLKDVISSVNSLEQGRSYTFPDALK